MENGRRPFPPCATGGGKPLRGFSTLHGGGASLVGANSFATCRAAARVSRMNPLLQHGARYQ
ncbi:hypothetical protein E0E53_17090 [Azotobacter chroococcum]|nr:hypothetical protein E0E53_17090 [Azotobacter chroococcum]